MNKAYRLRRIFFVFVSLSFFAYSMIINTPTQTEIKTKKISVQANESNLALQVLEKIPIKGRAPKTDYTREKFGATWIKTQGCDTRNIILNRDLVDAVVDSECNVISGILNDPYTGKVISFVRGVSTAGAVQIDHVVALSDAWQKGAQQMSQQQRIEFANDPLELLAVDGASNQQKSDGDAATWLPPNKSFRCQYVARQIAIKYKYNLWATQAEHDTMNTVLNKCPNQLLPNP